MPLDIAIVGAGPAGAFAAFLLARQGARVTLFDPSHPREKPCGGGVTGRALALVSAQLGAAALAGVPIATSRFDDPMDRSASVRLHQRGFSPDSSLIVVSRAAFDKALLDGAIQAGAQFRPHRVTSVETSDREAIVRTADGVWQGDFVLGADGANSFVRRKLYRPFERRQLSIATGFYAHGTSSEEIVIRFVPEPQGYIWSFPRPDHLAIGICAQADESQPGPLRTIVADWIRQTGIAGSARLEPYSWPIPSLSADDLAYDYPAGDRWMLLGDAAGLVDPITREGIYFALCSAMMAVAALNHRDPPNVYHQQLEDDIHPELARAAQLKQQFFRGPFTRLLIDALQRSEPVRDIMRDLVAGQQSYARLKGRLLRTFEIGLAWQLLRLELGRA